MPKVLTVSELSQEKEKISEALEKLDLTSDKIKNSKEVKKLIKRLKDVRSRYNYLTSSVLEDFYIDLFKNPWFQNQFSEKEYSDLFSHPMYNLTRTLTIFFPNYRSLSYDILDRKDITNRLKEAKEAIDLLSQILEKTDPKVSYSGTISLLSFISKALPVSTIFFAEDKDYLKKYLSIINKTKEIVNARENITKDFSFEEDVSSELREILRELTTTQMPQMMVPPPFFMFGGPFCMEDYPEFIDDEEFLRPGSVFDYLQKSGKSEKKTEKKSKIDLLAEKIESHPKFEEYPELKETFSKVIMPKIRELAEATKSLEIKKLELPDYINNIELLRLNGTKLEVEEFSRAAEEIKDKKEAKSFIEELYSFSSKFSVTSLKPLLPAPLAKEALYARIYDSYELFELLDSQIKDGKKILTNEELKPFVNAYLRSVSAGSYYDSKLLLKLLEIQTFKKSVIRAATKSGVVFKALFDLSGEDLLKELKLIPEELWKSKIGYLKNKIFHYINYSLPELEGKNKKFFKDFLREALKHEEIKSEVITALNTTYPSQINEKAVKFLKESSIDISNKSSDASISLDSATYNLDYVRRSAQRVLPKWTESLIDLGVDKDLEAKATNLINDLDATLIRLSRKLSEKKKKQRTR